MARNQNGAGFKSGFMLGSFVGGVIGFLFGSRRSAEDDEIGKTVAELASRSRAFVNDIRKILADAFAEGRRAARETADTSRVQREDLDLDNPNL